MLRQRLGRPLECLRLDEKFVEHSLKEYLGEANVETADLTALGDYMARLEKMAARR